MIVFNKLDVLQILVKYHKAEAGKVILREFTKSFPELGILV